MKATIVLDNGYAEKHEYEGDCPDDIVSQLMRDQDLYCLLRMGPQFGDDVSQLQIFIDKYEEGELTSDDIKNMNIVLAIGTIKCENFKE